MEIMCALNFNSDGRNTLKWILDAYWADFWSSDKKILHFPISPIRTPISPPFRSSVTCNFYTRKSQRKHLISSFDNSADFPYYTFRYIWFVCRSGSSRGHRGTVDHGFESQGQGQGRCVPVDAHGGQQGAVCSGVHGGRALYVAFLQRNQRYLYSSRCSTWLHRRSELIWVFSLWITNSRYNLIMSNSGWSYQMKLFRFFNEYCYDEVSFIIFFPYYIFINLCK